MVNKHTRTHTHGSSVAAEANDNERQRLFILNLSFSIIETLIINYDSCNMRPYTDSLILNSVTNRFIPQVTDLSQM